MTDARDLALVDRIATMPRAEIVVEYRWLRRHAVASTDWPSLNHAIIERYGIDGLRAIKKEAWK